MAAPQFTSDDIEKLELISGLTQAQLDAQLQRLSIMRTTAGLFFAAIGLTFAGYTGLFQAEIIDAKKVSFQLVLLELFLLALALICAFRAVVINGWQISPLPSGLIGQFNSGVEKGTILSRVIASASSAYDNNERANAKSQRWQAFALGFLIAALVVVIVTYLWPNLSIVV